MNAYPLKLGKDDNGNTTYGINLAPNPKYRVTLVDTGTASVVVPDGYSMVLFTYGKGSGDVWVDFYGTPNLPNSSFVLTTSLLNPILVHGVSGGQTISCLAAGGTCTIHMSLFK